MKNCSVICGSTYINILIYENREATGLEIEKNYLFNNANQELLII